MTDGAGEHGTFEAGRETWLRRIGAVRNVIRQEMITRQLSAHLGPSPATVLDIGAGQGTQALRLAASGYTVTAVEPDPQMQDAFAAHLAEHSDQVRSRVTLRRGGLGSIEELTAGESFDAVLMHGVLMYLPAGEPAIREAAQRVRPGGVLAVAVRNTISTLWRPAVRQDWPAALAAFEEFDAARAEGRDVRYLNEIGSPARADSIDRLTAAAVVEGLHLENWYGVRVAVDSAELDAMPPDDPDELARLLDVEERLGAMEPFRQLGQLAHLIFRRPAR